MAIKQFVAFTIHVLVQHRHKRTHIVHKIVITAKRNTASQPTRTYKIRVPFTFYMLNCNHKRLAHCIANCAHLLLACAMYTHSKHHSAPMTDGAISFWVTCYTSITLIMIMIIITIIKIEHHFGYVHIEMTIKQMKDRKTEKNLAHSHMRTFLSTMQFSLFLNVDVEFHVAHDYPLWREEISHAKCCWSSFLLVHCVA